MKLTFVNQNKGAILHDEILFEQLPPNDDYFKLGYFISVQNVEIIWNEDPLATIRNPKYTSFQIFNDEV